ncbi:PHD finger-like domain-containing protein 5A [Sparganum proliferum]
MAKHHPDLIFCRKQPGVSIGRLCEKCDGKCVISLKPTYSMSERNMGLKRDDIGFALYLGNSFYREYGHVLGSRRSLLLFLKDGSAP